MKGIILEGKFFSNHLKEKRDKEHRREATTEEDHKNEIIGNKDTTIRHTDKTTEQLQGLRTDSRTTGNLTRIIAIHPIGEIIQGIMVTIMDIADHGKTRTIIHDKLRDDQGIRIFLEEMATIRKDANRSKIQITETIIGLQTKTSEINKADIP
jgi:hypothetical protein